MSLNENLRHNHKREQKTPMTIEEAQAKKNTEICNERINSFIYHSTHIITRPLHEILNHIEMNGHKLKFKRPNNAVTDGSLLKTNYKKLHGRCRRIRS
jgi:hypothetical protein